MTGNPANSGGAQNAGFAPEVPRTPLLVPVDAAEAIRGGGCEELKLLARFWPVKDYPLGRDIFFDKEESHGRPKMSYYGQAML
jgi:hypothetical protein